MMKTFIDTVMFVLVIFCAYNFLKYIPRLKAWLTCLKQQKRIHNEKQNRIAVIIPARDESFVITQLFESLKKQSYKNFGCHVIVKDPFDKSIELTKNFGGKVIVVENQTCKGDALDACLKNILKNDSEEYDAYLICDADCVLDTNFLLEMNNALASNKQIIQGKKVVKNYLSHSSNANTLASECNGIIWTIIDELGNRYKTEKDIVNMTIGTGIMLRSDVVKELKGWPYRQTLTEDIELMYDCILRNFTTYYYQHALIYVEEATSLNMTNKRRFRWLKGVIDSTRLYIKKLKDLPQTKENKRNIYYTTALCPVYNFIGGLSVIIGFNFMLGSVLFLSGNMLWTNCLFYGSIAFSSIYFMFFVLTAFCMIIDRKYIKLSLFRKIVLLFVHPLFYMGYIPIIASCLLFNKDKGWEVIERVDFAREEK